MKKTVRGKIATGALINVRMSLVGIVVNTRDV